MIVELDSRSWNQSLVVRYMVDVSSFVRLLKHETLAVKPEMVET